MCCESMKLQPGDEIVVRIYPPIATTVEFSLVRNGDDHNRGNIYKMSVGVSNNLGVVMQMISDFCGFEFIEISNSMEGVCRVIRYRVGD